MFEIVTCETVFITQNKTGLQQQRQWINNWVERACERHSVTSQDGEWNLNILEGQVCSTFEMTTLNYSFYLSFNLLVLLLSTFCYHWVKPAIKYFHKLSSVVIYIYTFAEL